MSKSSSYSSLRKQYERQSTASESVYHKSIKRLIFKYSNEIDWKELLDICYALKVELINVSIISRWIKLFEKLEKIMLHDIEVLYYVFTSIKSLL